MDVAAGHRDTQSLECVSGSHLATTWMLRGKIVRTLEAGGGRRLVSGSAHNQV
jgi:hypothetical protein